MAVAPKRHPQRRWLARFWGGDVLVTSLVYFLAPASGDVCVCVGVRVFRLRLRERFRLSWCFGWGSCLFYLWLGSMRQQQRRCISFACVHFILFTRRFMVFPLVGGFRCDLQRLEPATRSTVDA